MDSTGITAADIERHLLDHADPDRVPVLQRFFRTGPGEYGAGDVFLGIRVPEVRKLSRRYRGVSLETATALLMSAYHEARLLALLILVDAFRRGDHEERRRIYHIYLASTTHINSWDLVDSSAEHIVGAYLAGRDRSPLDRLARSPLLWDRRIAMLATFHFIRRDEFDDTLRLAELLLRDEHDLIHKAVGWMLREVGKRDIDRAEQFLVRHYRRMPRTMLRYAIERFAPDRRRAYLEGTA